MAAMTRRDLSSRSVVPLSAPIECISVWRCDAKSPMMEAPISSVSTTVRCASRSFCVAVRVRSLVASSRACCSSRSARSSGRQPSSSSRGSATTARFSSAARAPALALCSRARASSPARSAFGAEPTSSSICSTSSRTDTRSASPRSMDARRAGPMTSPRASTRARNAVSSCLHSCSYPANIARDMGSPRSVGTAGSRQRFHTLHAQLQL
eukprot:scaffold1394_cov109-Isochrysis_galbana.AAC.33